MLVTLFVFQLASEVKSLVEVLSNMKLILVTLLTSKLEPSNLLKVELPENARDQSVPIAFTFSPLVLLKAIVGP